MVRQVALVPAGCQPWNQNVVAAHKERFAYCATLAVYVYEMDPLSRQYRLMSIMSEHKKTITCVGWCPDNADHLATCSTDGTVIVWDVVRQVVISKLVHKEALMCLDWSHSGDNCLGLINKAGPLWLWHPYNSKYLSVVKETQNFSAAVTSFRWHHSKTNQLAFGHQDGSVSVLSVGTKAVKHIFKLEVGPDGEEVNDPVVALEWDPLSVDYLLVCNHKQGVRLVDVPNQQPIMFFQLPSAASRIQTMAWIQNAPGMFVTGDYKGGILRVWSVSNHTPIENIKIKATGFHCLKVVASTSSHISDDYADETDEQTQHCSSTSEALATTISAKTRCSVPHAQLVCTFVDGGVGLYDLGRRKWIFLREEGHIETIFDCKFKPDNPDHLATASFDGTIKIWDITSMTCLTSSPGNQGIIYHISWAPADLNCILACTAKNGAFIWDVKKNKIIRRINSHAPKTSIFCVAWNQLDSKRFVTSGADMYCMVHQVDGTLVQKYKHPAAVYGCDWSPFNKDMIATGCEDKILRVFYLASHSDQPIKKFTGHDSKVFHVKWNPLREGVLCSGSDDCNIRVWDYTKDQCTCVLKGHSAPVRGLTWNSEVANLLISGSWDYSIRIWDTRDGACLHTVLDHGADVYGLTTHPQRPFLLASSSRDSTVRLWSLTTLVQSIQLAKLAGTPHKEVLGAGEPTIPIVSMSLNGQVSKDLCESSANQRAALVIEKWAKFFSHPCGTTNLWDLVAVICGRDTLTLSPSYATGIVHRKHITQFKGSEAQHQEMIKMSKFGAGIGAPSKEDRLKAAAEIHIRLGNIQRYCELMVELGKWERALAVAPAVSMKYWQQLNQRYTATLLQEDSDTAVPFCIAGGQIETLVSFFIGRGQLSDAAVVAQSACEGSITPPKVKGSSKDRDMNGDNNDSLLVGVMKNLANFHFNSGSPTLATCCHLAVDDVKLAMSKLIRGHELELALSVGRVLGEKAAKETDFVLEMLSRRCEALGRWDLGLDLLSLQQFPSDAKLRLCARCSSSMAEINALHAKAGLPTMEMCEEKGEALSSSGSQVEDCVKYYLLSPTPEVGLELGLQFIKDHLKSRSWTVDQIFPMIELLGCIKTERLQQSKNSSLMFELLTVSAYVGALMAMKRGYLIVAESMLGHARAMIEKESVQCGLSGELVKEHLALIQAVVRKRLTPELEADYQSLLMRCGPNPDWMGEAGPDCVASSHLPSHSDVHVSLISGTRIKGQAFFLEDGRSALSLSEALMWAKVNPFSPLGSGVRINPF